MCELLIRVVDKVDPLRSEDENRRFTKRGDVIVVVEDQWPWGREELSFFEWRIVCLPDVQVDEASMLLTSEIKQPGHKATLRPRAFYFDLDLLPRDFLNDNSRVVPKLHLPGLDIDALKRTKAR
jgi:hypothetical protein